MEPRRIMVRKSAFWLQLCAGAIYELIKYVECDNHLVSEIHGHKFGHTAGIENDEEVIRASVENKWNISIADK